MKNKFKKVAIALLVLMLIVGCQKPKTTSEIVEAEVVDSAVEERFTDFLDKEFENYVASDPTAYHFTLKDAEAYGIEKPEMSWGEMTLESFEEHDDALKNSLKELDKIERSKLSLESQRYYDAIKRAYEDDIELNKYPLNKNYLSANDGIQENIIIILTEWVFHDEEDVQDYLSLLEDLPRYLDTVEDFAQIQIDKGYWFPEFVISSSIDSLDKFTEKEEDNALIISFNGRLDKLNLSDAARYKEDNKELVQQSILPAYRDLRNFLAENKDIYEGTGAALEYPDGKEYYIALARSKTSSLLSVEELITMGDEYFNDKIIKFISNSSTSKIDEFLEFEKDSPPATEILDFLEKNLARDYPQGPAVTYEATYLDPSIANESTIAYYLTPPVDAIEENVIRINGSFNSDYLEFVRTLAHEGFPGHLYQTTYLFDKGLHPLLYQIDYIGYTEGWAMMAGDQSIRWLDLEDLEFAEISIVNNQLGYMNAAVTDMKINYLGWTASDIAKDMRISEEEAQSMYEYYIENQGMLLPYGIGMMMFDLMEEEAREELGNKFSLEEYNRVLLDGGYRSFEEVQKDVDAYVENNR